MNRSKLNYWVDIGLLITFLLSAITGIFKFPMWTNFFGFIFQIIPHRLLSKIHDWSGLVMVLLVLVHLIMHWRWIVAMTKNIFKRGNK
jgi:cytochrome b subunit of formate dehydrogenase